MADAPLFSIIIPTYNNLQLFCQALQSVRRQTVQDYEVIVVDDSTDNAIEEFVRQNPLPQLRYHHNVPPRGAVSNWNYGLSLAGRQYVILLHHDEAFESPRHLQCLRELMDGGTEVAVTGVKVSKGARTVAKRHNALRRLLLSRPASLLCCNYIGPCACLCFTRRCLQQFDNRLLWLVDAEWYYRLLAKRKTVFEPRLYVLSCHEHADKITNRINISKAYSQDYTTLRSKYRDRPGASFFLIMSRLYMWLHAVSHR